MSNNDENEIKNREEEISECSTNTDITDDNGNNIQLILDKTFICRIKDCGQEYSNKYVYKRHLRERHSEETLRCDYLGCDYVTSDKRYLRQHLIVHIDYWPFICLIDGCEKKFKRKSELEIHRTSHSWQRFRCTREGCQQTFKAVEYLKRHIDEIHPTTPKSFVCSDCGNCFGTRSKRQYHQRVVHRTVDQPIKYSIGNCNQ